MQHITEHLWKQVEQLVVENFPSIDDPGCAVLVLQGDESRSFVRGMADLESGAPVIPETNFRLASVAKQFTAACILQLRDAQQLRLDQFLPELLTGFPDYGKAITVEHLLRHTSGLKDYEPLVHPSEGPPVMDAEVLQLLMQQTTGDFPPGSRFRYSNSGYAVLAMIVEAISGLSYPDYLDKHIFRPLGMTTTLAFVNRPGSKPVPNRAIGYAFNKDQEFVQSDQGTTSAVLGDGGIYCSTVDYEKWILAYWDGRILKPSTVASAWQPTATSAGDPVPYGYGWRLEQRGPHWRPYHPGSTTGFRNGVVVVPEHRFAALVLTNRSSGDAVSIATAIERLFCVPK